MVTSIQHQFVDFNIQNRVSKLEMEDDKFKSKLHERKLEITDLSEQVVDVVNVEEFDKNNFDQNYKFERPACCGKVENNAVQNYMFERPGFSGEVESNTVPTYMFERPGFSEVESNVVPNAMFESPGCSGEVESNVVQNFIVPCKVLLLRLLKGGRPNDVTVLTPSDTIDLKLDAKNLPSSLMNEIVVFEILKPFLTAQAWKILRAFFLKRKTMKIWNCPICILNAPTESIKCSSRLEWYHFNCVKVTSKINKNW
ncbi:uncharacterized protein LOC136071734 isoform X2 [Hydra vulgaris]|uniref:uncharacterized protein LOC136071734 isoform X2 n=1 Tax=Hydra vulgaris TaxID=6087 RepID=UPI0032E9F86D